MMAAAIPSADPAIRAMQDEIAGLREEVNRLQAIIALYIAPNFDIFSENEEEKTALREAVKRKRDTLQSSPSRISDLEERVESCENKLGRRKNNLHDVRLKMTEAILIKHNNQPTSFADMGKLQGFPDRTRKQNMTHLGHAYEQYPEKYEVRVSKLGGKTIRLVPEYLKHLTEGRG